jgi:cell division protease FtsH
VEGRLVVAYGGRVAEELVFGPDQVTTGAAQDFAQATELARRMVTEFGMSDAMGPVSAGERDPRVFLGRDFTERRDISDRTAELIDAEVRRLATEAYERARDLVQTHLDALHGLAGALLERETLNREDVLRIVRGDTPVPAAAAR